MLKLWSLPTGVRNLNRLQYFLQPMSELAGREWNSQTAEQYLISLIMDHVYTPLTNCLSDEQEEMLSNCNKMISHEDAADILNALYLDYEFTARNYMHPLLRYELITIDHADRNKIKLTDIGRAFLEGKLSTEDVARNALLHWQYPRFVGNFEKSVYNIRPMIATMQIIQSVNEMDQQDGIDLTGIFREEFILFFMTTVHYNDLTKNIYDLHSIHLKRECACRNDLLIQYKNRLTQFERIKDETIHLYARGIMEAFRFTGLFRVDQCCFYIDLRKDKASEIKAILENNDVSASFL